MSNFEDLLKTLRDEYLASLPEKIALLKAQVSSADVAMLRDSFHKLKGTGRTYGMPEVSELSELGERVCIDRPQHAAAAGAHAIGLLQDIYVTRQKAEAFTLQNDGRFQSLQKLLQN